MQTATTSGRTGRGAGASTAPPRSAAHAPTVVAASKHVVHAWRRVGIGRESIRVVGIPRNEHLQATRAVNVTYVGHATVELESGGTRLLTDPVLRPRVLHLRRIAPLPPLGHLLRPDAVLISHAHFDHLDLPSLRLLGQCVVVAPRGCGRLLERAGMREVMEVGPGERLRIGTVEVSTERLDHDGRRHPLSRARETLAFVVDGTQRAFFAGDTGLFGGMSALADGIDVALLPVWGWGPRLGRGHMGPAQAARAASLLAPRIAIPIHWGTLASPRVPWLGDPAWPAKAFVDQVAATAAGVDVRVVPPGGHTEIVRVTAAGSEAE